MAGGSASALSLSRPAQASLTLRPAGSLSRLRRPLSRGFSPSGYPAKPLVSYQINRQFSGWILPPLVIRAFGAHGQQETCRLPFSLGQRLCDLAGMLDEEPRRMPASLITVHFGRGPQRRGWPQRSMLSSALFCRVQAPCSLAVLIALRNAACA